MPSDSSAVAASTDTFAQPRMLHPASILTGVPLGQLIQSLVFPAAAIFAAAGRFTFVALAVLIIVGLVIRVLHWRRFQFSFDGAVVRVDSGVLARHHRSIDIDRIQQVELDRPALQRALGVATIRIETAGSSSEPDIQLRVLRLEDAQEFRRVIRRSQQQRTTADGSETPPRLILAVPLQRIVLSAATGAQLLVLPTVIGALIGAMLQMVGDQLAEVIRTAQRLADSSGWVSTLLERQTAATILAIGLLLVFAVIAAIVVGVFRDGNFRIEDADGDLLIRRGLVGTRDSTVPRARMQRVEVLANPLRRALGLAAVRISSAGGGSGGTSRVTVPALPVAEAHELVRDLLGTALPLDTLQAHPPAAFRRALWRWGRLAVIAIAATTTIAARTGWPGSPLPVAIGVSVAALLAAALTARADYRLLAHGVTDELVIARSGPFITVVSVAPLTKIQASSTAASWFQRRLGVGSLTAHVAGPGGDVTVRDAGLDTLDGVHATLRTAAAAPWSIVRDITLPTGPSPGHH